VILAIFLIIVTAALIVATHEIVDASLRDNSPEDSEDYKVNVKPQLELLKALEKKNEK
jgi:hypothetical protein